MSALGNSHILPSGGLRLLIPGLTDLKPTLSEASPNNMDYTNLSRMGQSSTEVSDYNFRSRKKENSSLKNPLKKFKDPRHDALRLNLLYN